MREGFIHTEEAGIEPAAVITTANGFEDRGIPRTHLLPKGAKRPLLWMRLFLQRETGGFPAVVDAAELGVRIEANRAEDSDGLAGGLAAEAHDDDLILLVELGKNRSELRPAGPNR